MGTAEIIGIIMTSNVLTAAITTVGVLATRGSDRFEKITKALDDRISDLEDELKTTKSVFGIALRHIREVVIWGTSDRTMPLPNPPEEIMEYLLLGVDGTRGT